jgi:hypothetical protein
MSDQQKPDDLIDAKVLAGAVMYGVGDSLISAVTGQVESVEKLSSQLIEPGDQRHIPHPWENFKSRLMWTASLITPPGDMNNAHSPHPINTALQMHDSMAKLATELLDKKGLVEGTRELSAIATAVIVDNADPLKKLRLANAVTNPVLPDWDTYAKLLGNGSQPPKLKPLHDFSDLVEYKKPSPFIEHSYASYAPRPDHKIEANLTHHWSTGNDPRILYTDMDYLVKINPKYRVELGSGSELFNALLTRIQVHNGIRVDSIKGGWHRGGDLSTNYDAYTQARAAGATVKQAVSSTHGGRWAANAGYTDVGGVRFRYQIEHEMPRDAYHPEFTRPVFSDDPAYQIYGEKWAGSQGRASQNVISRHEAVDVPKALSKPNLPLSGLTQEQADTFRQYIHDHIDKHFDALFSGRNIDPEVK